MSLASVEGTRVSSAGRFGQLPAPEATQIASSARIRRLTAKEEVAAEGEVSTGVHLLISGWTCQYRMLPDGRRQILAFNIPGDILNVSLHGPQRMDHSIVALTNVELRQTPHWRMEQMAEQHPAIRATLLDELRRVSAIQREWALSLGRRSATQRIGHLLCELHFRLMRHGEAEPDRCDFPISQAALGDAMGMTSVHVNRVLQDLRTSGQIVLKRRQLQFLDLERLQRESLFEPSYLS